MGPAGHRDVPGRSATHRPGRNNGYALRLIRLTGKRAMLRLEGGAGKPDRGADSPPSARRAGLAALRFARRAALDGLAGIGLLGPRRLGSPWLAPAPADCRLRSGVGALVGRLLRALLRLCGVGVARGLLAGGSVRGLPSCRPWARRLRARSARLRLFSWSDLKSVSYQPPPFKRNTGADISVLQLRLAAMRALLQRRIADLLHGLQRVAAAACTGTRRKACVPSSRRCRSQPRPKV